MSGYILPAIGSKGKYTFKPPFDTVIPNGTILSCQGVKTINEVISNKEDPYELYYMKYNIEESVYNTHRDANTPIVSLVSGSNWYYVPAIYISTLPLEDGVPYHKAGLSVILGMIPVQKDLTGVIAKISNVVRDTLGIKPAINLIQMSKPTSIKKIDDSTIKTKREKLIVDPDTDSFKLIVLNKKLTEANAKVKVLEDYIIKHDKDNVILVKDRDDLIISLRAEIKRLEDSSTGNTDVVTSLQSSIVSLNNKITELNGAIGDKDSTITTLNERITYLENKLDSLA